MRQSISGAASATSRGARIILQVKFPLPELPPLARRSPPSRVPARLLSRVLPRRSVGDGAAAVGPEPDYQPKGYGEPHIYPLRHARLAHALNDAFALGADEADGFYWPDSFQ